MIRGVIFDLGGTLMHFEGNWQEINARSTARLSDFLRAQGIAVGDDFPASFRAARERGWKIAEEQGFEARVEDALTEALADLGSNFSSDGLVSRAVDIHFDEGEKCWQAYPDAIATLQELLRRGLQVGLISNSDNEQIVHHSVNRLGFKPYLDPVLSSAADPRWRKPDPRIFYLVLDAWKIAPNEIVMVGDSPRYDILGAHRANMRGILIDRGDNAPWQKIPDELANDPLIKPDATVKALADIPDILDSWLPR